jgi:ubiquinone/menaquinone biosynthesis C-methylase UbiE
VAGVDHKERVHMRRLFRLVLRGGVALLLAQLLVRIYIQLRPLPTPPFVSFLLTSSWRRRYRDPARTLAPLGLRAGIRVLELGPGVGVFTAEAARLVGRDGLLLCIDLQRGMLRPLLRLVRRAGLANVSVQAGDATALPLADGAIDLAYLIAVLPMLPDKRRALAELRRVLKPGGVLAVSEELIEPEYVPIGVTTRWCRRAGFIPRARYGNVWCYMLVCEAPGSA